MKLIDTILFSLTFVAFIIGVHQTFYFGITASYWIFMISLAFLLIYNYRKPKKEEESRQVNSKRQTKKYQVKK